MGGLRLPVKSTLSSPCPFSRGLVLESLIWSPATVAVMVSLRVALTVLPLASLCWTTWSRVSTSWPSSILVEAVGSTLPTAHIMLDWSCPLTSSTPSHPAAPPGSVSSQLPRNGLFAAAASRKATINASREMRIRMEKKSVVMPPLCPTLPTRARKFARSGDYSFDVHTGRDYFNLVLINEIHAQPAPLCADAAPFRCRAFRFRRHRPGPDPSQALHHRAGNRKGAVGL